MKICLVLLYVYVDNKTLILTQSDMYLSEKENNSKKYVDQRQKEE